jgi:hypothetical protein
LDFSEDLAAVKKNDKWGFIDKTGKVVIDLIYDYEYDMYTAEHQYPFKDGRAKVYKNGKYGMIDKNGIEVIPTIYDNIRYFLNSDGSGYKYDGGYVIAVNDGKYGILDYYTGEIVVPLIYDHIE